MRLEGISPAVYRRQPKQYACTGFSSKLPEISNFSRSRYRKAPMARVFIALLIAWVCQLAFWPGSAHAAKRYYLLEAPVEFSARNPWWLTAGIIGKSVGEAVIGTSAIFYTSGSPTAAGTYAAVKMITAPRIAGEIRAGVALQAFRGRNKQLKPVASNEGAEVIRTLTFNEYDNKILHPTAQSRSFVFLEVEGDQPPAEISVADPNAPGGQKTVKWNEIASLEETKIRLEIKIPNGAKELAPAEFSVADLFEGMVLPSKNRRAWNEAVSEWEKAEVEAGRITWKNKLTKSHLKKIELATSLVQDGKVLPLGNLPEGKYVGSLLGRLPSQAFARMYFSLMPKALGTWQSGRPLKTSEIRVVKDKSCSSWYRRMMQKDILVQ